MPDTVHPLHRLFESTVSDGLGLAERVAFWSAVALPCLHVPLLTARGLDDATAPALAALWTLHVLALLVGARYDPSAA